MNRRESQLCVSALERDMEELRLAAGRLAWRSSHRQPRAEKWRRVSKSIDMYNRVIFTIGYFALVCINNMNAGLTPPSRSSSTTGTPASSPPPPTRSASTCATRASGSAAR